MTVGRDGDSPGPATRGEGPTCIYRWTTPVAAPNSVWGCLMQTGKRPSLRFLCLPGVKFLCIWDPGGKDALFKGTCVSVFLGFLPRIRPQRKRTREVLPGRTCKPCSRPWPVTPTHLLCLSSGTQAAAGTVAGPGSGWWYRRSSPEMSTESVLDPSPPSYGEAEVREHPVGECTATVQTQGGMWPLTHPPASARGPVCVPVRSRS